jgi:hypothetical protein
VSLTFCSAEDSPSDAGAEHLAKHAPSPSHTCRPTVRRLTSAVRDAISKAQLRRLFTTLSSRVQRVLKTERSPGYAVNQPKSSYPVCVEGFRQGAMFAFVHSVVLPRSGEVARLGVWLSRWVCLKSQPVREENPMNRDLEGFGHASLHVDLDYLPSLSFSVNKRALFGNRFVTVHVKIDLFGRWIAVVPKHYLLGGSHASPLYRGTLPRPLSVQSRFINQPVRNFFPVMVVSILHRG